MKKKINKPMRAAGILLVATMLTTCMTAGTFAKYTTSDSATDTARVAKFGVNINVNGNLYGREYGVGNTTAPNYTQGTANKPISYTGTNVNTGSVQVFTAQGTAPAPSGTSDVVAPGTQNDTGLGISISGKPEVDTQTTINVEAKNIYLKKGTYGVMHVLGIANQDDFDEAWTSLGTATKSTTKLYAYDDETFTPVIAGNAYDEDAVYCKLTDMASPADFGDADYYFPVVYNLTGANNTYGASTTGTSQAADSLAAALTAMSNVDTNSTATLSSGNTTGWSTLTWTSGIMWANLAYDTVAPNETLTWAWTFHVSDAYDRLDTILGDLVAQDALAETDATNDNFQKDMTAANVNACRVVVLDTDTPADNTYSVPTAATTGNASAAGHLEPITTANDYNLYTGVYLDVTVTQVD